MKRISNFTTRGFGFFIQIFCAIFIVLLMLFTITELAPVSESRIADCSSRIEKLKISLIEAENTVETIDTDKIRSDIKKYEDRIQMLQNREKYYAISMLFLVCVALFGAFAESFKTKFFLPPPDGSSDYSRFNYYPLISSPLSAICVLLAIGVTYRTIFSLTKNDFIIFIIAIIFGFLAFFVYRQYPLIMAQLNAKKVGKHKVVTVSDILYFLPAIVIIALFGALFVFGDGDGAKLWISLPGGFQFQPGEFAKVLMIILFATSYGKLWKALVAIAISGFSILSFLVLKDMGGAVIIFAMLIIMFTLLLDNKMTFPLYEYKKLLIITLVISVALFVVALALFPHARERITNLGSVMEDPEKQQFKMIRAIIFGGLSGLGIADSTKIINIFAIDSDMALAGLTAIFGYGMLLIVLLCYALLIIIPIRKNSLYREFYFVSAQVSVVLFTQVLFNALGAVDVLPFTGIVAPFISNGGSALISFCTMSGLVLATLYPAIKPLEV